MQRAVKFAYLSNSVLDAPNYVRGKYQISQQTE